MVRKSMHREHKKPYTPCLRMELFDLSRLPYDFTFMAGGLVKGWEIHVPVAEYLPYPAGQE